MIRLATGSGPLEIRCYGMNFHVDLDCFRGPMDLLLYLVRKHEIDITDIPIAMITDQFLKHMAILESLDVNAVGDFLDLATILMEIKSRMVLPQMDEVPDMVEDPRDELVQRLLEYKQLRDAASLLEERGQQWQLRRARLANDLPPRRMEIGDQPIQEVELWDLVSAFGRVLRDVQQIQPSNIVYDETPIQTHMQRIYQRLKDEQQIAFSDMFDQRMHKSRMIGVFLAVLELVRHHSVDTRQDQLHGEIWIIPGEQFQEGSAFSDIDEYRGSALESEGTSELSQ